MSVKPWQTVGLIFGGTGIILLGYLGLRQPQWMFRLVSYLGSDVHFFVETNQPVVALTIDDGPHAKTTEAILQVLERHGAQATFFMLSDKLPGHNKTLQRLVAQGHELGNHMTVDESSFQLSPADFQRKFLRADRALSAYGSVRWFRPGMGWYNDRMLNVVESYGYCLVLGSLFPYDTHLPSEQFATWFVLNNLDPGDIWVLHDGPNHRGERTVRLLNQLLPQIRQRGYQVTTLTKLKTYERSDR